MIMKKRGRKAVGSAFSGSDKMSATILPNIRTKIKTGGNYIWQK